MREKCTLVCVLNVLSQSRVNFAWLVEVIIGAGLSTTRLALLVSSPIPTITIL